MQVIQKNIEHYWEQNSSKLFFCIQRELCSECIYAFNALGHFFKKNRIFNCFWYLRSLSLQTPRYLISAFELINLSPTLNSVSSWRLELPKKINSFLSGMILRWCNSKNYIHFSMAFASSSLNLRTSSWELSMTVSSAFCIVSLDKKMRLLTYRINERWPKTVPCWTPWATSIYPDLTFLIMTFCVLFER